VNPWLGLPLLLLGNLLWLLIVRWLGWLGVDSESTRKIFHAGNGTLLLTMPLLFGQDILPAIAWGAISAGLMLVLLLSPGLRSRLAGNVYDVRRISYGDIYFVFGVVLLFFFSAPTYYTYAVPLTMLSYADAVSALVGKRFGRHKYEATEGRKSIEGSLAFFAVAFIAALAWAPVLPNANPLQVTLIAMILGMVVMLLEAISWRGLDNLLIPLGGFILLRTYLMLELPRLVINLAVITLLVVFGLTWRRRTTLSDSALITGALFGYLAWTVAGTLWRSPYGSMALAWLICPLLLFIVYNMLFAPLLIEEHHERHSVDAVFGAVFAGALWLYLAFYFNRADFIIPYAASFACVAYSMFYEQKSTHDNVPALALPGVLVAAAAMLASACGALLLLDTTWIDGAPWLSIALCAAAGLVVSRLLRNSADRLLQPEQRLHWRWHVRGIAALLGSAVAALPLLQLHPAG
jgi:phytol kinase